MKNIKKKTYKYKRNKKDSMLVKRKERYRWELGNLDLISAGLFIFGLYLSQDISIFLNFKVSIIGFILMGLGVLKQLSKK